MCYPETGARGELFGRGLLLTGQVPGEPKKRKGRQENRRRR